MSLSNDNLQNELLEFVYQIPIGICETRMDGTILRLNPFFIQLMFKLIDNYDPQTVPNLMTVLNQLDPGLAAALGNASAVGQKRLCRNRDIWMDKHGVKALRLNIQKLSNDRLIFLVEDITSLKEAEDARRKKEFFEASSAITFSLASLAETRDDDTGKHLERVQVFCRMLSENLMKKDLPDYPITGEFLDTIYFASPLHDIGKVGVPDAILLKPGKLLPEEFEIMKNHTRIGAGTLKKILGQFPDNSLVSMGMIIALHHHERWDGSGYPDGLSGKSIPLPARIMAVADVYDALRTARVYKQAFPHEQCVGIIEKDTGSHFDPKISIAFLEIEEKLNQTYNSMKD